MYILSADKLNYEFDDATVSFIHKSVGDKVNEGDKVLELMTAKAVIVVESPVTGLINEISVKTDDVVDLESKLCVIDLIEGNK